VEFTGGEPFLRKDLVDIVSKTYKTSITAGSLTTNGLSTNVITRKTKKILESIAENKSLTLGVSLDGGRNLYARIRGVDGFKKALLTFLKLRDLKKEYVNFQPHIAYTISHLNAGNFKEFYEHLNTEEDIGIYEFSFTVEHFKRLYYGENPESKTASYKGFRNEAEKDVKHILNLLDSSKIKINKSAVGWIKEKFYRFYLKNISSFLEQPNKMVIPCAASKLSAYIDPYGYVYPCTMWNIKLGNIKEMSFSDIWMSEKADYIRRTIKQGKCPNCWTPCEAQPSFLGNLEKVFWRSLFK
jgi:MoaA/NifB/PqqE/SkfB family radical SAM enzyme